jgi:predicted AAA+ superfamily ATPase
MAPASPLGEILARHAEGRVSAALRDTRVVLVSGARQAGKSTLVQICAPADARSVVLDNAADRNAAIADPVEFVRGDRPLVIDEVQRAPDLLLAIKESVDADPRPGRFLLTGSASLAAMRAVPDALPGRMETVELWPLSQGEIGGAPDRFIDAVFGDVTLDHESTEAREGYLSRLVRGGFPEAVARTDAARRERFLDSYVADLLSRDVMSVADVEHTAALRSLVRLVAARSGQLLVPGNLASSLELPRNTIARYLGLLEAVFLIKRVPAFSRNLSARAVGTAKVAFVDSGIAANLVGADIENLGRPDSQLGPLLEGFVLMELARATTWAQARVELSHYRTKDGAEVDAVLEDRRGRVVGVEVKARSTVTERDFSGLRHLAARLGPDFLHGIVLYTGARTLSFGPGLRAVPLSALWELAPPD